MYVFDGLIAEPADGREAAPRAEVLEAAEQACLRNPTRSWKIQLAVKPLHGLYQTADDPLPTITAAREALRAVEAQMA